jgi:hypothetical protein
MSGKCVIKANDMTPQMSKFATKVGVEALQEAQTEQVSSAGFVVSWGSDGGRGGAAEVLAGK